MSDKDFNKPHDNNIDSQDELSSILKRLSELLDSSVSLEDAIEMAKKQGETDTPTAAVEEITAIEETSPVVEEKEETEVPAPISEEAEETKEPSPAYEETEYEGEPEPISQETDISEEIIIDEKKDKETAEHTYVSEDTENEDYISSEEEPSYVTPKIFSELMECFDEKQIPNDYRFSKYLNNEQKLGETEEQSEDSAKSEEKSIEEIQLVSDSTQESENEFSQLGFEEENTAQDDALFSQIFSEEKAEKKDRERDRKKWQRNENEKTGFLLGLLDWLEVIVISSALALLIFTFVMRLAIVDGDSMKNTLHDKELLIISNLMYEPEQNDIVVFSSPNFPEPIVKRVIATEGQVVDIDFDTWTVTVDGIPLKEDYVNKVSGSMDKYDVTFPVKVPEGHIFVMGDNRNESLDSRSERIGFVDERYILGEVKLRLFPINKFGVVE